MREEVTPAEKWRQAEEVVGERCRVQVVDVVCFVCVAHVLSVADSSAP